MDIDQFLARYAPVWERLQKLTERAGVSVRRLSGAELKELIALYQRTASHLSYAQSNFNEPALNARLSQQVAAAGAVIYGGRPRAGHEARQFFTRTLPAALWHSRWFVAASAILTLGPAIAVGAWLATSPAAVNASAPAAVRQAYVNQDFASYYSSEPAEDFASQVYNNNIHVAAEAFAFGILVCVLTALILVYNGYGIGQAAGLFTAAGQTSKFYGLVLPHGMLELTSVIIAGAAGLRLGWAVIDPGDRRRLSAVAEEGQRSVVMVAGVILTLMVAGAIEGFVTGSGLSTVVRVGIGATVEVAFLVYAVVLGRTAVAQGFTGALREGGR